MIRFGLRLTVTGGREAAVRLGIIAVAVALGVAMLLAAVAAMTGVRQQADRYGWANAVQDDTGTLRWRLRIDTYAGASLARVDVAPEPGNTLVPPGIDRLPEPGEFYASPALRKLLAAEPPEQLAARFPATFAGTIGPAALPSPDSLVAIVGHRELPGATTISTIPDTAPVSCPDGCWSGVPAVAMRLILGVVAVALIFPLLILIGSATRLAASRREQRYAAMRLAGATPRQVATVSAVESGVSALAGTLLGIALFYALRGTLASIPVTGEAMYPADLAPGFLGCAVVAVGVPVASVLAARFALRRVQISPLGVSRRARRRPPRAWRLVPLLLGLAELTYFVGRRPHGADAQVTAYLSGILVVMVGLVVAGPWLTMTASRLLARRARRPAALIAARRLADDPGAGFRAVSGMVLALFVSSVAAGAIATNAADQGSTEPANAADLFYLFRDEATRPTGVVTPPELAGQAIVVRTPPRRPDDGPDAVASCADLARIASPLPCLPGARTAWVYVDPTDVPDFFTAAAWPTADVDPARLSSLPAEAIVVRTDGTLAGVERARTVLGAAYPSKWGAITGADWQRSQTALWSAWQRLADVVTVTSLVIAGLSLAVAATGGLVERRRPFSMLRLTGAPLGMLRRVVALESATPLLVAAALAVAMGLFSAHLFARAQLGESLRFPGVTYVVVVVLGVLASLAVIFSTLPLLRRVTGPEAARNG
ncbi:FtsX-like permease family protein [Actinoplanes sp. RD1]|uniref:FtsX-like permease family protein n=1 Tax=Actinoplanes sp. RD1 TaxID=3064538 RepID=UPI0027413C77|nr:FtsX-like permease family protein [Actinoplanes sp. RD1]